MVYYWFDSRLKSGNYCWQIHWIYYLFISHAFASHWIPDKLVVNGLLWNSSLKSGSHRKVKALISWNSHYIIGLLVIGVKTLVKTWLDSIMYIRVLSTPDVRFLVCNWYVLVCSMSHQANRLRSENIERRSGDIWQYWSEREK